MSDFLRQLTQHLQQFESEEPEEETTEQPQQRTEEWFKERMFCYTGSKGKTIMSCNPKGSKMSWDNTDKVNEFSSGIISYIYETAMQRKTNRYIKTASTTEMKYGTAVEPLIEKRSREEYFNAKGLVRVPVGFKTFPNRPYAGASSDDIITKNDKIIAVCENKACTSWKAHYKRTYDNTDESDIDFWQTQMEMIAWEVDLCYYIVISPPTDILKYAYYDGDIMDLYDEWCAETEMTIEEIKRSPIHCEALLKRIDILEAVTNEFLETNEKIDVILDRVKNGFITEVAEGVKPEPKKELPNDLPF